MLNLWGVSLMTIQLLVVPCPAPQRLNAVLADRALNLVWILRCCLLSVVFEARAAE